MDRKRAKGSVVIDHRRCAIIIGDIIKSVSKGFLTIQSNAFQVQSHVCLQNLPHYLLV